MNNEFEDKTREELEKLVKYYRSEHVIICGYWKNEIEEHKKTKNELKNLKVRLENYRLELNDLKEHYVEKKSRDFDLEKKEVMSRIFKDLDDMKASGTNDVCV